MQDAHVKIFQMLFHYSDFAGLLLVLQKNTIYDKN